jgi:hypothetical protein
MNELTAIRERVTAPVGSADIHRDSSYRDSSYIETPEAGRQWDEFNLPDWLTPFVQNLGWAKRLASLLNEGHYAQVRKLVEVIEETAHTSKIRFMNKSCSYDNWEATLDRMNEHLATDRLANEVEQRLDLKGTDREKRAIYAACYRLRGAVIQYAVTVQEYAHLGKVKTTAFKFFNYLVSPKALERQRLALAAWPSGVAA